MKEKKINWFSFVIAVIIIVVSIILYFSGFRLSNLFQVARKNLLQKKVIFQTNVEYLMKSDKS